LSDIIIRADSITRAFRGRKAVNSVSLEVVRGRIFAVLGASGAGKTTLLRMLNGLDRPDNGAVWFDGQDLHALHGRERLAARRRMAMVFQGAQVFDRTVCDNVAYGLVVRGVAPDRREDLVKAALELVGLGGFRNRRARTLSGGELQRLAFAMATVFKPEVLLLDEPTANLDPINEGIIHEIINRINHLGITVVLSTHRQEAALELADRVAVLRDGNLEQAGTPQEIFFSPGSGFVAGFTGMVNFLRGRVVADGAPGYVLVELEPPRTGGHPFILEVSWHSEGRPDMPMLDLHWRPEDVNMVPGNGPVAGFEALRSAYPNGWIELPGKVERISARGGALVRYRVALENRTMWVDVIRSRARELKLDIGDPVLLQFEGANCRAVISGP